MCSQTWKRPNSGVAWQDPQVGVDEGQVKEPVVGKEDGDQDQDESQDHDDGQGT